MFIFLPIRVPLLDRHCQRRMKYLIDISTVDCPKANIANAWIKTADITNRFVIVFLQFNFSNYAEIISPTIIGGKSDF
jgi:hypothetical protein